MHALLAIAKLTFKENIRRKTTFWLSLFFIMLMTFISSTIKGDGTDQGQIRVVIAYMSYLSFFILTGVSVFLAANLISSEWKEKTLYTLDIKPLSRLTLIAGKILGLLSVSTFLLSIIFITGVFHSYYQLDKKPDSKNTQTLKKQFKYSRQVINPNLSHELQEQLNTGKKTYGININKSFSWTFKAPNNLPQDGGVTLRYKIYAARGQENRNPSVLWTLGDPSKDSGFARIRTHGRVNAYHEISLPNQIIQAGQPFKVTAINPDINNDEILFPFIDGLNLVVPSRIVWINIAMGLCGLTIQLLLLITITVTLTTFLSRPVALLTVLTFYLVANMRSFLSEMSAKSYQAGQANQGINYVLDSVVSNMTSIIFKFLAGASKYIIPDFVNSSPIPYFYRGLNIPFDLFIYHQILYPGLFILLSFSVGCLIFKHREIGLGQS